MSKGQLAFKTTRAFDKSFPVLPRHIQESTLAKLALYEKEPRHPSLRVKKLKGTTDIWEMSITKNYRITFSAGGTKRLTQEHWLSCYPEENVIPMPVYVGAADVKSCKHAQAGVKGGPANLV